MSQPIHVRVTEEYRNLATVDFIVASRAASRLRDSDNRLWGEAARLEASQRLGWIAAAGNVDEVIERAEELQRSLEDVTYSKVFLCGMGGSSLSPQVVAHNTTIPLIAVDSIHPDFIQATLSAEMLADAIVIVSSKSGGTSETRVQLSHCEAVLNAAGSSASERIIVITDPDSELEEYARLRGYRTILGHPLVGGRYSALTVFGIVPSVLAGADLTNMAHDVAATLRILGRDAANNPAIQTAAALKDAMHETGTAQFVSEDFPRLPHWIQQLVAESTGKDGRGLLPLPRAPHEVTSTGGAVVSLSSGSSSLDENADISVGASLGAHFIFWEFVTALLCVSIGVNPFDQPDVERTKRAARMMKPGEGIPEHTTEILPGVEVILPLSKLVHDSCDTFTDEFVDRAKDASYVTIQAFVPSPNLTIEEIGMHIERITGTPTTVSYGPEYLHSTGQLHKGGQPGGLFLNIFQVPHAEITVPGTITTFGWLCASASLADQKVLRGLGRAIAGVRIDNKKVLDPLAQHLRLIS